MKQRLSTSFTLLAMMFLTLLCQTNSVSAQERKVQNRPYIDARAWHYGFLFGMHMQDIEFVNNGFINTLENGTEESWYADVASYTPGFSVGVLGEARLNTYFSFRVIPSMLFGDKTVSYFDQLGKVRVQQAVKSTYLSIPLDIKYSAQRFNNYRPYLVAGLSPVADLTIKKQKEILVQRFDCYVEVGMGCDFYLPFFKLIPELKFCFGLRDIIVQNRQDLIDKNLLKYTQSISSGYSKMLMLTLYFE